MNSGVLPRGLSAAIEKRLEGQSRKKLAERATHLSEAYRAGQSSGKAVVNESDLGAYLAVRMPATYAAIHSALSRTLDQIEGFTPLSVLDIGCGPGTAAHAALDLIPGLEHLTLIDSHPAFLTLARDLGRETGHPLFASAQTVHADITRSVRSNTQAEIIGDLVVAGYVLAELDELTAPKIAERLWSMTRGLLLLVEPGTTAGFARIRAARERLLSLGANIVAPCPHANACPIVDPDWCHFTQRVQRSRDHMAVKGVDAPFEDEPYIYVAFARDGIEITHPSARILAPIIDAKPGRTLKLCTEQGIETRMVPVRDKEATRAIRRLDWGDPLPILNHP